MESQLSLAIIGILVLYMVVICSTKVELGAIVLLFGPYFIIPATGQFFASVDIGPITLYIQDGFDIILLGAFFLREIRGQSTFFRGEKTYSKYLIIGFVGLVLLSITRGFFLNGTLSFADGRRYTSVIAPLLYFSSFRYTTIIISRILKSLVVVGILLVGFFIVRWGTWGGDFSGKSDFVAYDAFRDHIGISTRGIVILLSWLALLIRYLYSPKSIKVFEWILIVMLDGSGCS